MDTQLRDTEHVVIVGAGIVGCALADELALRGITRVTIVDQGPLFATGGSTSHAPGLVFQTNPSKTMTAFAAYTVTKYTELGCFDQVGGLEVATTPARLRDLERKHGWATAWGVGGRLVDPAEAVTLHPMLDPDAVLGGFYVPTDGLARAVDAAEAQAGRATAAGARFLGGQTVTGFTDRDGRVTGVVTDQGTIEADVVVCCAGLWGSRLGELAGTPIPLQPLAHQYVRTTPLETPGSAPILRHQDRDLYFRLHDGPRGGAVGIGSYAHRPMPVEPVLPAELPFTQADFEESWTAAAELLPALASAAVDEGLNGIFSFTPDGFPLIGESPALRGLWVAEAVWVTHSAGVARAVADWLTTGRPGLDLHEADLNRFEPAQLAPSYVRRRGIQGFIEVYDVIHPLQPMEQPRPLRTTPFFTRHHELGAVFLEAAGWERPHWFEANAGLPEVAQVAPRADEWAARYWSPIAGAEALVTRQRVALYDMTSLRRLSVTGPDALPFLQRLTTNQLDKPVGSVTYTLLLDKGGGVRGDVTVARLGPDTFQVGINSPLDEDWLRGHLSADERVHLADITGGTCCLGVWGPLARELVGPLTDMDLSFGYFKARQGYVGEVPVTALRLSYVGELGWELYTSAEHGPRLWDLLWEAGQPLGIIAAGRAAFSSLRLEKGYRLTGVDMTIEHTPAEAGLEFAVRLDKGDFLGRDALLANPPVRQRLCCLTFDDPNDVVLGKEPVVEGGYVTSAAFGHTIDRSIAYAWLPPALTATGTRVHVRYFGRDLPATVTPEPLFDPKMERLKA